MTSLRQIPGNANDLFVVGVIHIDAACDPTSGLISDFYVSATNENSISRHICSYWRSWIMTLPANHELKHDCFFLVGFALSRHRSTAGFSKM
jgi:hypothetical protein